MINADQHTLLNARKKRCHIYKNYQIVLRARAHTLADTVAWKWQKFPTLIKMVPEKKTHTSHTHSHTRAPFVRSVDWNRRWKKKNIISHTCCNRWTANQKKKKYLYHMFICVRQNSCILVWHTKNSDCTKFHTIEHGDQILVIKQIYANKCENRGSR